MHSAVHQLFMAVALNLVIASPFLAFLLQRSGFIGEGAGVVTIGRAVVIPLAMLSAGAGLLHVAGLRAELGLGAGVAAIFGPQPRSSWCGPCCGSDGRRRGSRPRA